MTDQATTPEERRRHALELHARSLRLLLDKDMDGWVELWADDGVFEFPFAPPGYPRRLDGKAAVREYIKDYPAHVDLEAFHDVTVHQTLDPDVMVVEMRSEGLAVATGKAYDMTYVSVIETRAGKIARYRDYWNPLAVADSLGGMDSLKAAFGASDA